MPNIAVLIQDRAAAAYASELDYAISMQFNAAHLPSGSSPSLLAEESPAATTTPLSRHGQRLPNGNVQGWIGV